MNKKISTPIAITLVIACAVLIGLAINWQFGLFPMGQDIGLISIHRQPTANWKTYRNEEYGFEIKYDSSLSVEDRKDVIRFIPPGDIYKEPHPPTFLVITVRRVDQQKTLEDLLKEEFGFYSAIDKMEKNTSLDNLQGYLVYISAPAYGSFYGHCYYVARKDGLLIDIYRGDWGLEFSSCGDDLDFNQMLSSFRFFR